MKMDANKILAIAALFLGLIAVFAGNPYSTVSTEVNNKDVIAALESSTDKIEALNLADWIIQAKADYRLVDIRKDSEYAKYFIPTAENIQIADLLNSDLMHNEKIVIYGEDDFASATAWFLMKANNFKGIQVLKGGIKAWQENILFPKLSSTPTAEELKNYNKVAEVSKFFGGSPQTGGESKKEIKMPELKAPVMTTLKRSGKKAKREGC